MLGNHPTINNTHQLISSLSDHPVEYRVYFAWSKSCPELNFPQMALPPIAEAHDQLFSNYRLISQLSHQVSTDWI